MEIENSDNDNVLRFRLTVNGRCSQMIVKTDAYQNGLRLHGHSSKASGPSH